MQALEIGNLRSVAGFDESFESLLDERRQAAAKHSLFAEEIAFRFFFERGLQNAGAGRADPMRVGESEFVSVAAGILLNREQRWNAAAFGINAANEVAGALGSNHHDVNVVRRHDSFEMNAEAVRNAEHLAGMQIRLDGLLVEFALGFVGSEYVDPVGALGGLVWSDDDHAVGSRLLRAGPVGVEANDNFVSAVAEILGLGVSLAAVTEDGDRLALQCLGLRVAFIKNSDHQCAPLDAALVGQGRKRKALAVGARTAPAERGLIPQTDRSVGIWKCYLYAIRVSSGKSGSPDKSSRKTPGEKWIDSFQSLVGFPS